jgi:hypothetical protein
MYFERGHVTAITSLQFDVFKRSSDVLHFASERNRRIALVMVRPGRAKPQQKKATIDCHANHPSVIVGQNELWK